MENKFYNHHVIKHAALMLWDTIGLLDCKITSSRMSLKGRTGNGERARGKRKWRMGTKPHLIPSSITNFITHSIFFISLFLFFRSPRSFPVSRSPFPVPRFSNIATQNCASAVIIFNMPRENKGRRAGLKISGDELPVEKGLYKGCPLLPLYPFSTCVNKIYKNLRDTKCFT